MMIASRYRLRTARCNCAELITSGSWRDCANIGLSCYDDVRPRIWS
jgi:hypothetical protein